MIWRVAALAVAAIALLVGAIVWAGANPFEAANALFQGSLGSNSAISGTLKETVPLLIAGLAVFIALRAGLFNIGVEGQLVVGAMVCAVVALAISGIAGLIAGLIVGAAAGALWALPAGLIKAYRGGHEVISTIMLNNVAGFLTLYMTAGPIQAPNQENTTTSTLAQSSMLPILYDARQLVISSSMLIALLLLALFAFWLKRTVSGYELSLAGANARAANLAGVSTKRVTVWAMTVSGAIAGLAGALQVVGFEGRFYAGFSPGYGFDALGVAILAGSSPLGIIPAALGFGILSKGSTSVQLFGVPKGITVLLVGLLIIVFAAVRYRRHSSEE